MPSVIASEPPPEAPVLTHIREDIDRSSGRLTDMLFNLYDTVLDDIEAFDDFHRILVLDENDRVEKIERVISKSAVGRGERLTS